MTEVSTTQLANPVHDRARILDWLDRFFTGMGQGVNAYMERRGRWAEIERLHAMSDEQLAKEVGITRDRIAYYVFADMFYV